MASKKRIRSQDSVSSNSSSGSVDKESKCGDLTPCQSGDSHSVTATTNGTHDTTDDTIDGRLQSEHDLFLQAFESRSLPLSTL